MNTKNIIFIGGIHGAGKGTICREIANELNVTSISASTLLKWEEVSDHPKNKAVKDISDTQRRLINGIDYYLEKGNYLIDGHFTLFDSKYNVTEIDSRVFQSISPLCMALVSADPIAIAKRLSERDNQKYDVDLLSRMQRTELKRAQQVSKELNIPLFIIDNTEFTQFKEYISTIINK